MFTLRLLYWWEMLRLWNEATKYFDTLKKVGLGQLLSTLLILEYIITINDKRRQNEK